MSSRRRVSETLASLSALTEEPGAELSETVSRLSVAVGQAVESFCGLSVNAGDSHGIIRFSVGPNGVPAPVTSPARSSLRLSSTVLTTGMPTLEIILLATRPGAFVDLAADITWATRPPPYALEVDRHLGSVEADGGDVEGLQAASAIDQAVGALLSQGTPGEQARSMIEARAQRDATTLAEAARRILREIAGGD